MPLFSVMRQRNYTRIILLTILCSGMSSLLLLAVWDILSPEVQLQIVSNICKNIFICPYYNIRWFHLYLLITMQL